MRLSLNITQGMRQEQAQKQVMSLGLRLEQRHEMALQMAGDINDHFEFDSADAPKKSYDHVVKSLAILEVNEEIRNAIEATMLHWAIKNHVLQSPTVFANEQRANLLDVIGGAYFEMAGGSFSLQGNMDARTTMGLFKKAIKSPDEMAVAIEKTRTLLQEDERGETTSAGTMQNLEETTNALSAAEALRPSIESTRSIMVALLNFPINGQKPLRDFFRDMIVFKNITPIISERIQSRYATRALQISRKDESKNMVHATMNMVGEYALASMGVIAPDLFIRRSGEMDEKSYEDARSILAKEGMNLDEQLKKYKLQDSGTFYFHRYATLDHKPSYITDELVRSFITETVRKNTEAVLIALEYQNDFFPKMKQAVTTNNDKSIEGRKNAHDEVRELMIVALGSQKFKEFLRDMIAGAWYEKLSVFMPEQKVPSKFSKPLPQSSE